MQKKYKETQSGGVSIGNTYAPKNSPFARMAIEEVSAGDAVIIPFDHEKAERDKGVSDAREWRNNELARADIEVNKIDDEGGDSKDFRAYRIGLRDWPQTLGFPDSEKPQRP